MAEDFKFQLSVKTKSGNMMNLRADTADELAEQIQAFTGMVPDIDGLESTVAAMETVYQVMGPDRGNGGGYSKPSGGGASAPATTAQPAAPGGGDGRECIHGKMNYRTGVGAKGPWKAYFCGAPQSTPKAEQCDPIWLR